LENETRRLALAVIALAIEDARRQHRALPALFDSRETFDFWCHAAGLAPEVLLERLRAWPRGIRPHERQQAA
jgi:hypothetical protein